MQLLKVLEQFDQLFSQEYKKYLEIHKELDVWRGKELDDESAKIVNEILKRIQDQYILLNSSFNFIRHRAELSVKAMNEYQLFVDTLKLSGAVEEVPKENAA